MKKRDVILISSLVLVAIVAVVLTLALRDEGDYVSVRVDGKEVARYDLKVDGEYSLNGGSNVLKIEGGEAWMIDADCPQISGKKCTAQGKISKNGQTITCLPNKLTVTVRGGEDDVDHVSK